MTGHAAPFHLALWIIDKEPVLFNLNSLHPRLNRRLLHCFYFGNMPWIFLKSKNCHSKHLDWSSLALMLQRKYLQAAHSKWEKDDRDNRCVVDAWKGDSSSIILFLMNINMHGQPVWSFFCVCVCTDWSVVSSGTNAWTYQPFYTSSLRLGTRWPEMDGDRFYPSLTFGAILQIVRSDQKKKFKWC